MSGTIFGLGLSQRVKSTGKPESGWKLYLYAANTSTPVVSYKDTGLTVGQEHPWPIIADASGMMPAFWLADGSYRVRGTSSNGGTIFFDLGSVLALGASSGSGGGGDTTDPNSVLSTGDVKWRPTAGLLSGWVRMNGRTIGSATSGASERANADTQTLFEYAWNNFSNTFCPVSSGRGISSAVDWAANKTIGTLDMRGRGTVGLDGMGNSLLGLITQGVDADTAATAFGEQTHIITIPEVPIITPTGTISVPTTLTKIRSVPSGAGTAFQLAITNSDSLGSDSTIVTIGAQTFTGTPFGSGSAHNNLPPGRLGSWYWRL